MTNASHKTKYLTVLFNDLLVNCNVKKSRLPGVTAANKKI